MPFLVFSDATESQAELNKVVSRKGCEDLMPLPPHSVRRLRPGRAAVIVCITGVSEALCVLRLLVLPLLLDSFVAG
ncbi:MAG: hypothetical protein M2R45_03492 [Verrucomicrobia subdivision 3 bacterium]|nr:hypothetical protein [Limisphaerales bacterium]MCS1415888.1 hypothetical protein [Limisphaerales bacterium]